MNLSILTNSPPAVSFNGFRKRVFSGVELENLERQIHGLGDRATVPDHEIQRGYLLDNTFYVFSNDKEGDHLTQWEKIKNAGKEARIAFVNGLSKIIHQ